MGMPSIRIIFEKLAATMENRGSSGTVALVLEEEQEEKVMSFGPDDDLSGKEISEDNKAQIALALKGGTNRPEKVEVYFCQTEYADLSDALAHFEMEEVNYIATGPGLPEEKKQEITKWVKEQREEGRTIKAVLPNHEANAEYIVNYATPSVTVDGKEYEADAFCSRIAGLLTGTPITEAATYAVLEDAEDCTREKRADINNQVDAGKLVLFYDAGAIRVARGVNSLTATTKEKPEDFRKIKIIEIMDSIAKDITNTVKANWIGKVPNSYDNKCLLVSAISEYLNGLVQSAVLSSASIEIDAEANKAYLKEHGKNVSTMTEDELRKANTGDAVFLKAEISMLDAMEDITIRFAI